MFFFGLGGVFYVAILLINAIAVLSEDRFLARKPGFGGQRDEASIKARMINLISSVRTVMRIPLIAINTLVIGYLLVLG